MSLRSDLEEMCERLGERIDEVEERVEELEDELTEPDDSNNIPRDERDTDDEDDEAEAEPQCERCPRRGVWCENVDNKLAAHDLRLAEHGRRFEHLRRELEAVILRHADDIAARYEARLSDVETGRPLKITGGAMLEEIEQRMGAMDERLCTDWSDAFKRITELEQRMADGGLKDGQTLRARVAALEESRKSDFHERGDSAFAMPFGTVRQCIDCGCLVGGGPTRCARCAREVNLTEPSESIEALKARATLSARQGGDHERRSPQDIWPRTQADLGEANARCVYCGGSYHTCAPDSQLRELVLAARDFGTWCDSHLTTSTGGRLTRVRNALKPFEAIMTRVRNALEPFEAIK